MTPPHAAAVQPKAMLAAQLSRWAALTKRVFDARQLLQLTLPVAWRYEAEPLAILAVCGSAAIEFRCRAPCRDGKLHPIHREIRRMSVKAPTQIEAG
jgi:hypothetical protein